MRNCFQALCPHKPSHLLWTEIFLYEYIYLNFQVVRKLHEVLS
ncbi:hypothetical protein EVA_21613 [gut metagenome]|uniref:Uncharacterized protein n=1 Tax=gut metagenome TaxID=749906 RepID=J9F5W2_9ZZZZ